MTLAAERVASRSNAWLERAACRPGMTDRDISKCCPTCPVRRECLDDAFATGDTETYRAGMTGKTRTKWWKTQHITVQPPPTPVTVPRPNTGPHRIDLDEVARLREDRLSWREIGYRLGISPETIRQRYAASGRPHTGRAPNATRDLHHEIDPRDIAARVQAGQSIRSIAYDLRIDWTTANRHVQRARNQGLIP